MKEMITSINNPKIKGYLKLLKKKYRKESNAFIIEGFNIVQEAKNAGLIIEILTSDNSVEGTLVAPFILKKFTSSISPQSIVAIVKKPKDKALGNKVLALDNIQDPGNLGTLIRTAKAFGFSDVVVNGAEVFSPKTLRSSQGAIFGINIIETKDISLYFEDKEIIGALLDKNAKEYDQIKKPKDFVLVLGNEGNGISKDIIKKLTTKIYIPIEFESLNVASAGAILMNYLK